MSIKVGQIRKNNTSYVTDVPFSIGTYTIAGINNQSFSDFAIIATNNFQLNTTYYLRLKIQRIDINENMGNTIGAGDNDPHNLNIDVRLYADTINTSVYQTIGDPILIQPYSSGESSESLTQEGAFIEWCDACIAVDGTPTMSNGVQNYFEALKQSYENKQSNIVQVNSSIENAYQTIELVFTPYKTAKYLVFQLRRVAYDYNIAPRVIELYEDPDTSEITQELFTVNNILPVSTANKIGIQSRPGTLTIINQEPMRIGKSGTLEINNGIVIKSVGFVAPAGNINDFILDYTYNT